MIEPIIYAVFGFLAGGLLLLGLIPVVHARAVRLTYRRLEAMAPMSMAEIHAHNDRLRAEFAMSTRRLEMSVEQVAAAAAGQLAQLGKKGEVISRLRLEHSRQLAAILALEARRKALADELGSTTSALAARTCALQAAERALAGTSAALVEVTSDFHESAMMAGCGRIELVVLRARREVLESQVEGHAKQIEDLQLRIEAGAANSAATAHELAEERSKTDALGTRVEALDRQLMVKSIETEIFTRRAQELVARLEEPTLRLARRECGTELCEPAAVQRIEVPEPPDRVGPDETALASRESAQVFATFREVSAEPLAASI